MIKSLERKQIDTDKHEIMKRKRKESYAAMAGTPRHKKRKEAMKIFSQAQHTNITGTPEHEKRKEAMRVISRAQQIKITGTPEHEKRKEAMRNRNQNLRAKIAASPSLKNSDFRKNIKKFKEEIQNWPYFICVISNRCLYRRAVLIFNENKYDILFYLRLYL